MRLSIVSTLYHSAAHLEEFCARVRTSAAAVTDDYELILVNDGSPDNSLEIALGQLGKDQRLRIVDLARNFGHHKAMMAGLEHSSGDLVYLIDSDLEEEPEWLQDFHLLMEESGADVVYGRQAERKGGWFERWSGELYYSIFNWLCNIDHPRNIVTARLMTRRYVDQLLRYRERELVISCLWVTTGFKQVERVVMKQSKKATTYSLSKKIGHATNAITSFSEVPLRLIFYVGASVFLCALVYASYLVVMRLYREQVVDGYTSLMVSIWLLGGMIISFVGVVGIYLSKVFSETKQRPHTIIRHIYGKYETRH